MTCYNNIQIQNSCGAYPRIITMGGRQFVSYLDVHAVRKAHICEDSISINTEVESPSTIESQSNNMCLNRTPIMTQEVYNNLINKVTFNRFDNEWYFKWYQGNPITQLVFIILEILKDKETIINEEVELNTKIINQTFKNHIVKEWPDEFTTSALTVFIRQGILTHISNDTYKVLTDRFVDASLFRYVDDLEMLKP